MQYWQRFKWIVLATKVLNYLSRIEKEIQKRFYRICRVEKGVNLEAMAYLA